jgi:hypothetical protein
METTVPDASPARLALDPGEARMPLHALREPRPEPWDTPTLSSAGFLRVGSVVPFTAPESVLAFSQDGTAEGLVPDPTVIPVEVTTWAKDELAGVPSHELDLSDVVSGRCAHVWEVALDAGVTGSPTWTVICTLDVHADTQQHEAWGADELVASTPARKRRPSPRKRVA